MWDFSSDEENLEQGHPTNSTVKYLFDEETFRTGAPSESYCEIYADENFRTGAHKCEIILMMQI